MLLFSLITSVLSIGFALVLRTMVKRYATGTGKQIEIWHAIKEGSRAYLRRQNKTVGIVAVCLGMVIWVVFGFATLWLCAARGLWTWL